MILAHALVLLIGAGLDRRLFEREPLRDVIGKQHGRERFLLRRERCLLHSGVCSCEVRLHGGVCFHELWLYGGNGCIELRHGYWCHHRLLWIEGICLKESIVVSCVARDLGMLGKVLFELRTETCFQRFRIGGGNVDLDAVAAVVDFVNAFMEAVCYNAVFADEVISQFGRHGIHLLFGKFELAACLVPPFLPERFLFRSRSISILREDGTDGGDGSTCGRFGNACR